MVDCTRTWSFVPLGGGQTTLQPCHAVGTEVRKVPDELETYERSFSGCVGITGAVHDVTYTFPHLEWIVSQSQMELIEDGFVRCNRGQRLLTPEQQAQFLLWDEIEEIADIYPPDRAYVPGTVRAVDVGDGTLTSRHKPIFLCYFQTKPTFKPVSWPSPEGEQQYFMTCTLGEGDIYYAADALIAPTGAYAPGPAIDLNVLNASAVPLVAGSVN